MLLIYSQKRERKGWRDRRVAARKNGEKLGNKEGERERERERQREGEKASCLDRTAFSIENLVRSKYECYYSA